MSAAQRARPQVPRPALPSPRRMPPSSHGTSPPCPWAPRRRAAASRRASLWSRQAARRRGERRRRRAARRWDPVIQSALRRCCRLASLQVGLAIGGRWGCSLCVQSSKQEQAIVCEDEQPLISLCCRHGERGGCSRSRREPGGVICTYNPVLIILCKVDKKPGASAAAAAAGRPSSNHISTPEPAHITRANVSTPSCPRPPRPPAGARRRLEVPGRRRPPARTTPPRKPSPLPRPVSWGGRSRAG